MNTKKAAYFLVFALLFSFSAVALAAPIAEDVDTRYFIQSTSTLWKTTLSARHTFKDGFTADLSERQLWFAKLAGLKISVVKKLNILPAPASPELKRGEQTDLPDEVEPVLTALPEPVATIDESTAFIGPIAPAGLSEKKNQPAVDEEPPSTGEDETAAETDTAGKVLRKLLANRPVPSTQVSWGVKMIYNDSLLTKTSGGADVVVAVLDTGVNVEHTDLKKRIAECKDFTQPKTPIVDGKCDDKNGHGTHVAGIIAADGGDDGLGIYGIAPEANLLAYKVCSNSGSCWSDDVAVAIRTAADNGANILNMSFGSDVSSSLISDAIDYAVSMGVLPVAASGNDGPYQESIDYPGAMASVIAVGAVDGGRNVPDWSSRGINSKTDAYVVEEKDIEFAAPGVNIESTWKDGGYVILSGTSMAAPHIAGLAAKIWQSDVENAATATREFLQGLSSDILPVGDDDASGFGVPSI